MAYWFEDPVLRSLAPLALSTSVKGLTTILNIPKMFIGANVFPEGPAIGPSTMDTLATRCHPSRDILKAEHTPVTPLLPFLDPKERKHRTGSMVYFDCTWPKDWKPEDVPIRMSFRDCYPSEIQEKVLSLWSKYGY